MAPDHIGRIMPELERVGATSRGPGMRGPGPVRYFASPRIGTHLAGEARKAQAAAPRLVLVE